MAGIFAPPAAMGFPTANNDSQQHTASILPQGYNLLGLNSMQLQQMLLMQMQMAQLPNNQSANQLGGQVCMQRITIGQGVNFPVYLLPIS